MAVVVNEFEVVPEHAQPLAGEPAAAAPEAERKAPSAAELDRNLRLLRERRARLRAD